MDLSRTLTRRAFLACSAAVPCVAASTRRPNMVLLLADDLGYGELGCQGNKQIPTPHIDSIAKAGVRFTNGYVSAPFCSPSRAGLMTGRYQTRFGHELNPVGKMNLLPNVGLPASEKTVASCLKEAGYRTALIGKWHLGGVEQFHPMNHGFDEFFGFLHEGHFYVPGTETKIISHLRPKEPPYDDGNPLMRGHEPVAEPQYLAKAFGREACAFIDRNAKQPFFLYVPFNSVHSPMQAEPAEVDHFAKIADEHRRVFAAMLSALDQAVGSILDRLRANGLERDTLVIFLSDNGGPVEELTSSNAPLRGQKGQLFEGGIRIPFMVRWPGRIPSGRTIAEPVISLDLLPTILEAAGVTDVPPKPVDGVSLLSLLTSKRSAPVHKELYWRYDASGALRMGPWKIVRQRRRGDPETSWQLFNLDDDMSETRDLAAEQPSRLAEMVARWNKMNSEMIPPTMRSRTATNNPN